MKLSKDLSEPSRPAKDGFSRRRLLSSAAGLGALALLPRNALGQQPGEVPHELGLPKRPYGYRSPFESKVVRSSHGHTPLQDLYGIITPSELHYEVLHFGMPTINPAHHEILVGGLVERPLIFTMKDLERMPAVSQIHFLECAGNSGAEQDGFRGKTPQESHGQMSCTEWTGVRLSTVLEQVGLKPTARWILAEGADAGRLARSIPIEKALDDIPEQGYPVRLIVPGWEGNVNVKREHAHRIYQTGGNAWHKTQEFFSMVRYLTMQLNSTSSQFTRKCPMLDIK